MSMPLASAPQINVPAAVASTVSFLAPSFLHLSSSYRIVSYTFRRLDRRMSRSSPSFKLCKPGSRSFVSTTFLFFSPPLPLGNCYSRKISLKALQVMHRAHQPTDLPTVLLAEVTKQQSLFLSYLKVFMFRYVTFSASFLASFFFSLPVSVSSSSF